MPRKQTARKPRLARVSAPRAPALPPTPLSEPENPPVGRPDGLREIECTVENVHLGDGRQLSRGERAVCAPDIAALIVGNEQAEYVG